MSWGRVNHPNELVQVGDEINVKVLKFNVDTERVSLGLKQTTEDPWIYAEKKYNVGDRTVGTVVSLTDYGAFVELEEGIEGLIHISEMSWTRESSIPQDGCHWRRGRDHRSRHRSEEQAHQLGYEAE